MNKTIENATMNNTTTKLTGEEVHTIFEAVAEKVNEAIADGKTAWADFTYPQSCKGSTPILSMYADEALQIQFDDGGEPTEINPDSFLGVDGLEESDLSCLTLHFEGLTVEIECED